eukprot:CAMPEP_0115037046 /NCGR_PEP_ID=MMETSP0216-20121206/42528_1 /TAXON_ID=223996 /ORGANISM="Protocruzia adherens, Strain Boccale" /LENGTH=608 /DNA_ID=CAMNT_0002417077 /DNA_START=118 /DNA_END=1940 /DNA_ORIENTATION=+
MWSWFTLVELVVLFLVTIYMLLYYAVKHTPWFIRLNVVLGWYFSLIIIAILPLDIYYTLVDVDRADQSDGEIDEATENGGTGGHGNDDGLKTFWYVIYWTVFAGCWFLLPVLQDFCDAGEFSVKNRVIKGIKVNAFIYLIVGFIGAIVLIVLAVKGDFEDTSVSGFIMAVSYCWGLGLIIILLGYGLVQVPKALWHAGRCSENLRYTQFRVAQLEEKLNTAKFDLDDIVKAVLVICKDPAASHSYSRETEILIAKCPLDVLNQYEGQSLSYIRRDVMEEIGGNIDMKALVKLHKKLKVKISEHRRASIHFEEKIALGFRLQDICDSSHESTHRISSTFWDHRDGNIGYFTDILTWWWYHRVKLIVFRILAIVCGLMSISIVLSEITLFTDVNLSVFSYLVGDYKPGDEPNFYWVQFWALVGLTYICYCTYFGLFKVKIGGVFGLYPHQQTDPSSLLFSAFIMERLSTAICFNFLQIIRVKHTEFNAVTGEIHDFPLMTGALIEFYPIVLVFLCLFNIFNIYGKIMDFIGLKQFKFDADVDDERTEEGRRILSRLRTQRERQLRNSGISKKMHGFTTDILMELQASNWTTDNVARAASRTASRTSSLQS